jgi:replicative DNA helicase
MNGIIEAAKIEYKRELEERALYPFSELNYLTGGMEIGEVSIIAGETGSGKTTLVGQVQNRIMKDGDRVLAFYGESTIRKQFAIQLRQFTPYDRDTWEYKPYEKNGKKTNIGDYYIPVEAEEKARKFFEKRLYYYDCAKGMKIHQIRDAIQFCKDKGNVKYVFIDNLMQVDFTEGDELRAQKDATETLRRLAIEKEVHICLIAHYRKNSERLIRRRIEEIAGTSQIGNKAACAINVIRLDSIDKSTKEYRNMAEVLKRNDHDIEKADAIIEVLKTRFNRIGFVPLKYWHTTRTYSEVKKDGTSEERQEPSYEKPVVHAQGSLFDDAVPYVMPENIF